MAVVLSFSYFGLMPIYAMYQIAQVLKGRKRWIEVCCNISKQLMDSKIFIFDNLYISVCDQRFLLMVGLNTKSFIISFGPRSVLVQNYNCSVCASDKVLWIGNDQCCVWADC